MAQKQRTNGCCNPFNNPRHKKTSLRPVLSWMCQKIPTLTLDQKICNSCRKKISEMETEARESSDENTFHYQDLESVNKGLSIIGESPVIKSKLQGRQYPKEKLIKIKSAFMKSMLTSEDIDDESEMIKQLKEKFHETQEKSVKVQILTLLPMSWSIKKIENEFKASNYMVRKAKTLVKLGGILSTPNPNHGHNLHDHTIVMVQNFYESDEIS